ncbi:MAG: GTPase HflX [Flexistipes sinusarabici]|uniref:GTPase HflX n=1 Tax=Flexistipes sinusarabici TaxID=2352 RepID=A0A5D0MPP0_FLESI|nr:MAG: GTPase HflX [Flexistipes sinusarabici]
MLYGYTENLKAKFLKRFEKLDKRKSKSTAIISNDLIKTITSLSYETGQQIALLIDRNNTIQYVLVGTNKEVLIPKLHRFALVPGKLRGLRLVHTHLYNEELTDDDFTDLVLLRLDSVSAVTMDENGNPLQMHSAHIMPPDADKPYEVFTDKDPYDQKLDYSTFIKSLEEEVESKTKQLHETKLYESAILIGVYSNKHGAGESLAELRELAASASIEVMDTFYQIKNKPNPKYIVGSGKLKEIVIKALSSGVDYLIFDNQLSPAQSKAVANFTELKVIDRTQLILDIFAARAKSNEGKLRVELAQLKHILPKLSARDDSLSRLTGGIGGRGPGETKLEVDRRRINDRIAFLNKKLKNIEKNRNVQKGKRLKNNLPIVSIIGYTNAGKSTLLNALTKCDTYSDNLMFATLDTSSKRIRFPRERDVIITDTVGFIRDLPAGLKGAFKSTLEELDDSDLMLEVVDVSSYHYKQHIHSVAEILSELGLNEKRKILVFNKIDKLSEDEIFEIEREYPEAVFISAIKKSSLDSLLKKIQSVLFQEGKEVLFSG